VRTTTVSTLVGSILTSHDRTFMFLFFAFSATQVANEGASKAETADNSLIQAPNTSVLLYISLAFGFSLAVNVWVFFRITGGIFNPAVSDCNLRAQRSLRGVRLLISPSQVTLGMCLIGAIGYVRGMVVFTAQIIGAIASAAVVSALFPGPLKVRTSLAPGTSITRGLFIEMFLTAELVFTMCVSISDLQTCLC
jgi:aquaporin related protein